jgi:glycosyltransferase involved in cell wall biosynthesis
MTHLLVYTENYARGGGNSYMTDLVNAVSPLFDTVTVASNPGGVYAEDEARLGSTSPLVAVPVISEHRIWIEYHERWPRLTSVATRVVRRCQVLAFEGNVRLLRSLIRRVRPTAVLSCNGGYPAAPSVLAMVIAAGREKVPVVLSVVSMPEPRRPEHLERDRRTDMKVWRSVTAVVVNAEHIVPALVEMHEMPAGLTHVVHNGLAESAAPKIHAESGHGLTIGCVSRMEPMKGTEYLVDAFTKVAEAHPDTRLLMVGEGRSRDAAVRTLADRGLKDRALVEGWHDGDIEDVLAGVDIYAFPSLWEGLPYSILEAMRAGLPIVATDVGGVSEAIQDGVTGLLVAPGSSDALAAAISRLIDDPALRERLGAAARERFEKEFSLAAMHESAARVFREVGLA